MPTPDLRPKFDTLFAEARHYRGDLRLFRTAVRCGCLNDAPQTARDALLARFGAASDERHAAGLASDGQYVRVAFAEARAMLDVSGDDLAQRIRARRCWFERKAPTSTPIRTRGTSWANGWTWPMA